MENGSGNNKSSRSFWIAVFIAVILPVISFIFWEYKKQEDGLRIKQLPYLSQDSIPQFNFTDQDGRPVNRDSLVGRIAIADFFFTTCPGICPKLSSSMQRVQKYLKSEPRIDADWRLISHTVNPSIDSVARLKEYGQIYDVDSSRWYLVTGDKNELYHLSTDFYKLPAYDYSNDSTIAEPYTHSERLVLLDKKGYIRGYYDGTDSNSVDLLITDFLALDLSYAVKRKKD